MEDTNLRFFASFRGCITLEELRCSTESAILQLEAGTEELWDWSLLRHKNGAEIARIERYEITPFQLGEKTIHECVEEVRGKAPVPAANWLAEFLRRVQTFYVFRSLGCNASRSSPSKFSRYFRVDFLDSVAVAPAGMKRAG